MAKLNKGLLSAAGISGRLGNLVYFMRGGKQFVKTRPKKRVRKPSKQQTISRKRFKVVTEWLYGFTPILNIGFRHPRESMTALNYAVSYAYKHALTGEFPDFQLDFSKMLFSHGPLATAYLPNAECIGHEHLRFSWQYKNWGPDGSSDPVILIAVCEDPLLFIFTYAQATRASETGFLHTPGMKGKKMHTYIGFTNASGKKASDSVYTGEVLIN